MQLEPRENHTMDWGCRRNFSVSTASMTTENSSSMGSCILPRGTSFLGEWKIHKKELGRGTFGVVSLFRHSHTREFVAVKKFKVPQAYLESRSWGRIDKLKQKCKEEVERMRSIEHSNIVATVIPSPELISKIKEFLNENKSDQQEEHQEVCVDLPFLCMEYCSSGDLGQMLTKPENLSGLPEKEVLAVLSDISSAISYLHGLEPKKIIHRDIKPENIIIKYDDSSKRLMYKLSDLGLAKDVNPDSFCSSFVGSANYLAPEIYSGRLGGCLQYDRTVDFYSFGVIGYEISCGKLPFSKKDRQVANMQPNSSDSITEIRSCEIPEMTHLSEFHRISLSNWLPSMLQKDPSRRGRFKIKTDTGEKETCSLLKLQNMLTASYIEVHTPSAGRLVYRVRKFTKMEQVQGWIRQKTGLLIEDQLILTKSGKVVQSSDLACSFAYSKTVLYLVPKCGDQVNLKILTCQTISDFLREGREIYPERKALDVAGSKNVWIKALFHCQQQIQRSENLHGAFDALAKLKNSSGDESEIKELKMQIRERYFSLTQLMDFVVRLEEVDTQFVGRNPSLEPLFQLEKEMERLGTAVRDLQGQDSTSSGAAPKRCDMRHLTYLYQKFLTEFKEWKAITYIEKHRHYDMEKLRVLLSMFITAQQEILKQINSQMKLLLSMKLHLDDKKRHLQRLKEELDYFRRVVEKRRLDTLMMTLHFAMPIETPTVTPGTLTSSPVEITISSPTGSPISSSADYPREPIVTFDFTSPPSSESTSFSPSFQGQESVSSVVGSPTRRGPTSITNIIAGIFQPRRGSAPVINEQHQRSTSPTHTPNSMDEHEVETWVLLQP